MNDRDVKEIAKMSGKSLKFFLLAILFIIAIIGGLCALWVFCG